MYRSILTFIKEKKGLLALLSAFTTSNFFYMPIFILLPLIIIRYLEGGAYEFGISIAIFQVGGIAGSLLLGTKNPFNKNTSGVFYPLMLGTTGIFIATLGAAFGNIWVFFIGLVLNGTTGPMANISSQNIWQSVVPPEKMGRVFAVRRTIAQISAPAAMVARAYWLELSQCLPFYTYLQLQCISYYYQFGICLDSKQLKLI